MKLTAALARKTFLYERTTGILRYRIRANSRRAAGDIAGVVSKRGRRVISFYGKKYYASRIACLIVTGRWPSHEVDHENRDKLDDRWNNLRASTRAQNGYNRRSKRANKHGFFGIGRQSKAPFRYYAQIAVLGKRLNKCGFKDAFSAAMAYDAMAKKHHGKFARLNFS